MTKKEIERLKEIYLRACVRKERATVALTQALISGDQLTVKTVSHSIATAQQCAVMDVMMAFFDDATIDSIEAEAKKKYFADPTLFEED